MVVIATTVYAQTAPAISGTVRDITGLPIPRATVTIVTDSGQNVATVTTDESGRYTIERIPAGRYTASAESLGFARQSRSLVVDVGMRTLDFVLAVDVLTQTVAVSAQSPDSFHTQTATSALRTDVPLMDVPQAISIVPSEIFQQQDIREVGEVARTVSGMGRAVGYSESADKFMIRGLLTDYSLRNGFKNSSVLSFSDMANVERLEVLKGPSSLLYGRIEPGGVVNIVTKQPLAVRRQSADFTVGRYSLVRGVVDVTGPLGDSARASYRLVGSGEHDGSHRRFVSKTNGFFAPSFSWRMSTRTTVTLEGEALKMAGTPDAGLPGNPISFSLPITVSIGETKDSMRNQNLRAAYYVTHRFNDRWSLTNASSVLRADAFRKHVYAPNGTLLRDGRTFARPVLDESEASLSQFSRMDLVGKPVIGGQPHVILISAEGGRERYENGVSLLPISPIDIYQPGYGAPYPASEDPPQQVRRQGADSLGIVLQDQWTLSERWKATLGGRLDVARTLYFDLVNRPATAATPVGPPPGGGTMPPSSGGTMPPPGGGRPPGGGTGTPAFEPTRRESSERVNAVSPRLGLAFQPHRSTSLYVSYSRSFNPLQLIHYINLVNIKPFRATQYEGGVKLDLFGARLQTMAAVFALEATGYVLPDPGGPFGSVTYDGFKRSAGFEAEATAHPGRLSMRASYTFNTGDKRVGFPGTSLMNAARHSGSAWATWTGRDGMLQGVTFGAGVFTAGERVANLLDSLRIPKYARVDALLSYNRTKWSLQLNLKNITSARYYDTDAVQGLLLPGAPFSPELTFRVKL
jgi:iron complex outermembrane receptor protein